MRKKLKELMEHNGIESLSKVMSEEDILEILADLEYRLCLLELGVKEDDLQAM